MNIFDPFVFPFVLGVYILIGILVIKYFRWIKNLSKRDKYILKKGLKKYGFFSAVKEAFLEGLIHNRIWKINPLLGYMHMSLAFGWFLLILSGLLETEIQGQNEFNFFWEDIFYKYFERDVEVLPYHGFFNFLMDFLLLFILSGVLLAYLKRINSRLFGMKKTTRQILHDKLAITALWLIFPLRLAAESLTSGVYHNGGFLTDSLGSWLSTFLPVDMMYYSAWWAYSISLGTFFVFLPFSRYMHIPTEIILIFLRKAGLKTDKSFSSFSWFEVNSCSKCGICIDHCQLSADAGLRNAPPLYLNSAIRMRRVNPDKAFNCLLCGRCLEYCPVGINTIGLRISQRKKFIENNYSNFKYLTPYTIQKAKVAYFAGCMSHLTPSIIRSMKIIFKEANIDYSFIDENGSVCCGRPMFLSGKEDAARSLIEMNKSLIEASGATILVTSCPICYKEFKEKYNLGIEVLHHSEYLLQLVNSGNIKLNTKNLKVVYHDPCDLGRGSGVYQAPRDLLSSFTYLHKSEKEKKDVLCCGGSLANIMLTIKQKDDLREGVLKVLRKYEPDIIATACPLCKKTLSKGNDHVIRDIAEIVADAIKEQKNNKVPESVKILEFSK